MRGKKPLATNKLELVGLGEIAQIAGVDKSTVCLWRKRFSDFPKAIAQLSVGPIFVKAEVTLWILTCSPQVVRRGTKGGYAITQMRGF